MSLSSIPSPLRTAVRDRDGGRCCRLHQTGQVAAFHVDHVIPRSRGGPTSVENLALLCPYCSLHKSDKTASVAPATGEPAALFHPLQQNGDEHFIVLPDGTCAGLTPVGRATVAALQMNDRLPKSARMLQMMLGLI